MFIDEKNDESVTSTDSDLVELTDASDEDLDAFLESQSAPEPQEEGEAEVEASPKEQEKEGEKITEEDKEEVLSVEEKLKLAEEENAKLKKQAEDRERFVKHRSNEIGELRKTIATQKEQLKQLILELRDEDPEKALEAQDQLAELKKEEAALENEDNQLKYYHNSRQMLDKHVKPEDWDVESMSAALAEDQIPEQYVSSFKQNPLAFMRPDTLIQLVKRGKERKARVEAEDMAKQLAFYLKKAMAEIDTLKKKPGQVLAQVKKNLNKTPDMTNGSGRTPSKAKLDVSNLPDVPYEQLIEMLEK